MILDNTDIRDLLLKSTSDKPIKGYAIKLDGRVFRTNSGKILWKSKTHAMLAFRVSLEPKILDIARRKLISKGVSRYYDNPEYYNAWDNFKKYLEKEGLILIVELK